MPNTSVTREAIEMLNSVTKSLSCSGKYDALTELFDISREKYLMEETFSNCAAQLVLLSREIQQLRMPKWNGSHASNC